MKCSVAMILAVFGVAVANPVPSGVGLGWGGLGTVVLPSAVSHSSTIINHGLSIPVVKPIISVPIYTAPIIKTPIIPVPIIKAPIISSIGYGYGLNGGWGGLNGGWGGLNGGWGGLNGGWGGLNGGWGGLNGGWGGLNGLGWGGLGGKVGH